MHTRLEITGVHPEDLYGVRDVARMIGRSEGWLRRMISAGTIDSTKIGAGRVIPGSALIDYLETDFFDDVDVVEVVNTDTDNTEGVA